MLSPLAPESEVETSRVNTTNTIEGDDHQASSTVEDSMTHPLEQPPQDGAAASSPLEEKAPGTAAAADSGDDNKEDDDDDDDDVTVIVLDHSPEDAEGQRLTIAWTGEAGPAVEERRRNIMLRELQRVQRASFIHFLILCLIPTVLLFIVIATVISEDEDCFSEATVCHKEPRNFINAFTTRCVCEAIAVPRSN